MEAGCKFKQVATQGGEPGEGAVSLAQEIVQTNVVEQHMEDVDEVADDVIDARGGNAIGWDLGILLALKSIQGWNKVPNGKDSGQEVIFGLEVVCRDKVECLEGSDGVLVEERVGY